MNKGERNLSQLSGLRVYLPNGRLLGVVHDAVVEHASLSCTHLFVTETPEDLVEGSIHVVESWRKAPIQPTSHRIPLRPVIR